MKLFNKLFQGDKVIWMVVALLALSSLLAVYSATGTYANTSMVQQNECVITAEDIAKWEETISYEILTSVKRIKKIYVR